MRAAIYARVSTADQSCEMQLINLRDYLSSRGWVNAGEYVDTGWSGAKASRPQLDRLMRDARMRRFDAVLVWKLDRWGGSAGPRTTARGVLAQGAPDVSMAHCGNFMRRSRS
jgi:putative DNA-invertase from lambdoid prophage Rac